MSNSLRQQLADCLSGQEPKPSYVEAARSAGLLESSCDKRDSKVFKHDDQSEAKKSWQKAPKTPEQSNVARLSVEPSDVVLGPNAFKKIRLRDKKSSTDIGEANFKAKLNDQGENLGGKRSPITGSSDQAPAQAINVLFGLLKNRCHSELHAWAGG